MIKKLRFKFIIINMLIVSIMLSGILSTVYIYTKKNIDTSAEAMIESLRFGPVMRGIPELDSPVGEMSFPYFCVSVSPFGFVNVYEGDYFDLTDEESLLDLVRLTLATEDKSGVLNDYSLRYYKEESFGSVRIIYADISGEISILNHLRTTLFGISIAAFIIFLAISVLLARWAVKPVSEAWDQQRQFVADASHELKTPLTVIMTDAELLQADDCDDEQTSTLSRNILTMSKQMRGLVEDLLELARADNGTTKAVFENLDFSHITDEAVLLFDPVFFEKGLKLESAIEPGIFLSGSETHLNQLLEILLDNAQKYCYPDTSVTLTLRRSGHHCVLTVSDYGEPISKEDLKNIFKRFYRVDKARSMNSSYGLGLSIAEAVVKMHGGQIHAESANGVNSFIVQLPVI